MNATFFDLDGTLLHFTREYDDILRETFIEVCGRCEDSWVQSYSNSFFDYLMDFESEPYESAFGDVDTGCSSDVLVEELFENEIAMCQTPTGCEEYLSSVPDDRVLGVLTNGVSDWQRRKIEHFGLSSYFDSIVVSYDVGHHKPDKEIFKYAEDSVPATEFEMIGDSEEHDVDGARSVGWDARKYNQEGFELFFSNC